MTYFTIAQIKAANLLAGQFWFSKSNMKSFQCRLGRRVYGGKYFVSSERSQYINTVRRYTIRMIDEEGHICTVNGYRTYSYSKQAVTAIKKILRTVDNSL
jgi:hypothetical protein